jgi:predicted transcriptional regulator
MPNMTIRVPDDLKQRLDEHPEINWSEVARQSMREYLHRLDVADEIASRSELSEEDAVALSEDVKRQIAERYRDAE